MKSVLIIGRCRIDIEDVATFDWNSICDSACYNEGTAVLARSVGSHAYGNYRVPGLSMTEQVDYALSSTWDPFPAKKHACQIGPGRKRLHTLLKPHVADLPASLTDLCTTTSVFVLTSTF